MARQTRLSATQVERFEEQGYLVLRDVFDDGEVARMRDGFERLEELAHEVRTTGMHRGSQFVVEPDGPDRVHIHRIVWCGAAVPILSEFGRDPRLVQLATQLIGTPRVEQLINQAHFKFPGDGVDFEWHQDSKHRRYGTDLWTDVTGRGSFLETATAIDPMTPDNGPLQFIPGSHRHGHIPPDPDTGALPADAYDPDDAVTVTLEPGSVVIFGPYVIHGSPPNRGDTPRRLFLNGYAHPDANRRDYPGDGAGRILPDD